MSAGLSLTDAARRISGVRDALGEEALRLACHAAMPVVVDAGLLNLLRVNFFLDPPDDLPYEVEASLLLSPLFREIGEGLYETEPGLRNLLLSGLRRDYGDERVRLVATLLEQYTNASEAWRGLPELEAAQRLTAVSFLDPPLAEEWLTGAGPGAGAGLDREWYIAMRRRIDEQSVISSVGSVMILRLSGLSAEDAYQTANALLDIRTGPVRLRRVLVVDDTALLFQHFPVYESLDAARRVEAMLYVVVGPRAGDRQSLDLPGNLGGTQGHGVLWVSDPRGIDWPVAGAARAAGHRAGPVSGLQSLIELLSVDEVFDETRHTLQTRMPARVASPGLKLKLAGADDEAATFAAALAMAIRVITGNGTGIGGPFTALLPDAAGGASLDPRGPLVRYRYEVDDHIREAASALDRMSGLGSVFSGASGDFRRSLIGARDALSSLRNMVARLLSEARAASELPDGIFFAAAAEQSALYRVVAEAIEGGATLRLVSGRLAATERLVMRRGSAAYLPDIDQLCPAGLLHRLGSPSQRPPRRASAQVRQELGLTDASQAAQALTDLIIEVANREWSEATPSPADLSSVRITLDGADQGLEEYVGAAGDVGTAQGVRVEQVSEILLSVVRELVLRVVVAELASPSASGQEALAAARDRTVALLDEWARSVRAHGLSVPPAFAKPAVLKVPRPAEDDLTAIREVLSYPAAAEMWQLCRADDLSVLDVAAPQVTVRFAPRMTKEALAGTLPEEPVWTSTGSFAGLLRLVPLQYGVVIVSWVRP